MKNKKKREFKIVRTYADVLKDPRVDYICKEDDNSWWIDLRADFICRNMECSIIHEPTLKECFFYLNNDVVKR
jgi:hypothetical protein